MANFTAGLDLRALEPGFKSHFERGIGRYAKGLYPEVLKLGKSRGLEVVSLKTTDFVPPRAIQMLAGQIPVARTTIQDQFLVPLALNLRKLDFVHYLSHSDSPAYSGGHSVLTVHDLIPLKFPDLYQTGTTGLRYRFARCVETRAVKKALGIIAISEATKADIIELYGISADRIRVVHQGLDRDVVIKEAPVCREDKAALRESRGLDRNELILLYVGGIDPRKNVGFLVELVVFINGLGRRCRLVLCGGIQSDLHYRRLQEKIDSCEARSFVTETGYVPDRELGLYYALADVFVFASLYEGFGMPVLEAMATGLPVIAARNSSIPEVIGDTGVLVDDFDPSLWAQRIFSLARSDLGSFKSAAIDRAKKFTWERTAQGTLDAWDHFRQLS